MTHQDFMYRVMNDWTDSASLNENLKQMSRSLQQWNRDEFSHIQHRKKSLWERIRGGGGGGAGRGDDVPESSCCEKIKESYKARKEASRGIGSHLEPGRAPLISKTEGVMDKVWR